MEQREIAQALKHLREKNHYNFYPFSRKNMNKPVLDACCGARMFHYDKQNPDVVFMDIRSEEHELCDGRKLEVRPNLLGDFRSMPFDDNTFNMVLFDPPHLERAGKNSWMFKKYGVLRHGWEEDLRAGFAECFRVLKPGGTLVFKWSEVQVQLAKILTLTPYKPLVGHRSGKAMNTHWILFLKPDHD